MNVALLAQITGLFLALMLAVRALRTRRMDARRAAWMAAAWVAIIVVLTFIMTSLARM